MPTTLLTKLDEVVWSLCFVDLLAILLTELLVEVLQISKGQPWRVGGFTQHQVADTCLYDVTGGGGEGGKGEKREREGGQEGRGEGKKRGKGEREVVEGGKEEKMRVVVKLHTQVLGRELTGRLGYHTLLCICWESCWRAYEISASLCSDTLQSSSQTREH